MSWQSGPMETCAEAIKTSGGFWPNVILSQSTPDFIRQIFT